MTKIARIKKILRKFFYDNGKKKIARKSKVKILSANLTWKNALSLKPLQESMIFSEDDGNICR